MKRNKRTSKRALQAGDILAIPHGGDGYSFVIFVTHNRFGEVFGILRGRSSTPSLPDNWQANPIKTPVYTSDALVKTGRWEVVGHRPDLLQLFQKSPPIYHSKSDNIANDQIGQFGSAETADGELRPISESEARELGLLQGTYRQIMIGAQFENYVESTTRE